MREHRRDLPQWLAFTERPVPADARVPWFAVSGEYFEEFWLPLVGPTAAWMLRRVDALFETAGARHVPAIETSDLAARLGVGGRTEGDSVMGKTVARLCYFQLADWDGDTILAVHRAAPRLSPARVARLPRALAEKHEAIYAPKAVAS